MTCDYDDEYEKCQEDETNEKTVYCKTGEHSLIVYLCDKHKNKKITYDRMIEIMENNQGLYGGDTPIKLACTCLTEIESDAKVNLNHIDDSLNLKIAVETCPIVKMHLEQARKIIRSIKK